MSRQIPLPLAIPRHARFETFITGANGALVERLRTDETREPLWLWGQSGCGKSHLLQAVCAARSKHRTIYLPLARADALDPAVLDGLETVDLVAVDDVDRIADSLDWNRALFKLFNAMWEEGAQLVLAASAPPGELAFPLADLGSRLRAMLVYQIALLDERGLLQALKIQAQSRGLELSDAAARYLLTRVRRDMSGLSQCLERIDNAALASGRRLTIPLIRETLAGDA